jgi:hypothetical protein
MKTLPLLQHRTWCSPWENGYCESFNSKLRDELLAGEQFSTLHEAKRSDRIPHLAIARRHPRRSCRQRLVCPTLRSSKQSVSAPRGGSADDGVKSAEALDTLCINQFPVHCPSAIGTRPEFRACNALACSESARTSWGINWEVAFRLISVVCWRTVRARWGAFGMYKATAITLGIASLNVAMSATMYALGYDVLGVFLGGFAAVGLMGACWDRHKE